MARLRFGTDSLGKEILELVHAAPAAAASPPSLLQDGNGHDAAVEENKPYKGDNTIVMMEWERPYMRALVDALGITGAGRCTWGTYCCDCVVPGIWYSGVHNRLQHSQVQSTYRVLVFSH